MRPQSSLQIFGAVAAVSLSAAIQQASAIEIVLDYSLDTNNFFDTPAKRDAMRAVADFYENLIKDDLDAIDPTAPGTGTWDIVFSHPGTGASHMIANPVIPADTIVVYAGGRALTSAGRGGPGGWGASGGAAWFDAIRGRGEAGAILPAGSRTDFAPWGGSITFDTGRTWNFNTDGPNTFGSSEFIPVALHEIGHLLGIGTAGSWDDQISTALVPNVFIGSNSQASFGGPVPLDAINSHWQDDAACVAPDGYNPSNPLNVLSTAYGSFGTTHGTAKIALMDPSSCSVSGGSFNVMTDLDLAGLIDIGWEVCPPIDCDHAVTATNVTVNYNSTTFQTFTFEQSTNLTAWTPASGTAAGDGQPASFSQPVSGLRKFFRVRAALQSPPPSNITSPSPTGPAAGTDSQPERIATGCLSQTEL